MTDADTYIAAEVAVLRQAAAIASRRAADMRAADRLKQRIEAEQQARRTLRRRFTVEVEDDCGCTHSVCLLDISGTDMRAALDSGHIEDDEPFLAETAMREARTLYLVGRKADAMDALYPAIRDALGVAV